MDSFLYCGTYTSHGGRGIELARFCSLTGRLEKCGVAAEVTNPSYVSIDARKRLLLSVSEVARVGETDTGSLSSWRIDIATGELAAINTVSSAGQGPCHVALDRTAQIALVSNYNDGSVAAFRLNAEGMIGDRLAYFRFEGRSVHPQRQRSPHAHGSFVAPCNRFAVVPDLGCDRIRMFALDVARGRVLQQFYDGIPVAAGAGPRHFAFHPDGRTGFLLCELESIAIAYRCMPDGKGMVERQTISTLAKGFEGHNQAAGIAIDQSGRYLYCSNRGADDLAVFAIDGDGLLSPVERVGCGGKTPRHFALDPTERFLLVANQDSDEICVFSRDAIKGTLRNTGERMAVSRPSCIAFCPHVPAD